MKNRLYLITGWGEKITSKNYRDFIGSVKDRYTVVEIKLSLMSRQYVFGKTRLFSEVVKEAQGQIINPADQDVILGFSIGALITYQLATKIKFRLALLCSISPLLGRDLSSSSKKETANLTHRQLEELSGMDYQQPISPIVLFYGALESPEVIKRSKKLHNRFGGTLIPVTKGYHQLSGNYLETVRTFL